MGLARRPRMPYRLTVMGRRRTRRDVLTLGAGLAAGLSLAACGVSQPVAPGAAGGSSAAGAPAAQKPADLTPGLATSELVVGRNRFALGLIGEDSKPILDAKVRLDFFELSGD